MDFTLGGVPGAVASTITAPIECIRFLVLALARQASL